jgi:hypothetical protein
VIVIVARSMCTVIPVQSSYDYDGCVRVVSFLGVINCILLFYGGGYGSRETLVEQERDWTGLVMGQKGVYNNNNGQKHTCVQLRTATGMLRLGFFTNQQHLFSFRCKMSVRADSGAKGNFRHLQLLGGQK